MTPRFVISLVAAAVREDGLRRIPVAMVVRGYKGKQKFAVTASDLEQVAANFARRGTGDVVIDYDHSTEYVAGTGEPAPAAGWLKEIEPEPDGDKVLWGWAEFTKRASAMLDAKEYKYVSPVLVWGARDKESGDPMGCTLMSVALTNRPLFEEMPAVPLVASSEAGWAMNRGDAEFQEVSAVKKVILADRAAGTVRLIADDNTESVLAVEGLRILGIGDVKRGSDGKLDFASLAQETGALVASEVFHAQAVETELDAAIASNRITPAQRPQYAVMANADLKAFRTLVASMAKSAVDTTERGIGGGGEGETLDTVDSRIEELVKEKLVASGGKLEYTAAVNAVFAEHPDLKQRRRKLMGN